MQSISRWLKHLGLACCLACLAIAHAACAAEHHGQVTFNGLPVPGATVTATQGAKKFTAVSDMEGNYTFPDLADGPWKIDVEMSFFTTLHQDINIAPNMPGIKWELKMLPLDQVIAKSKVVVPQIQPVVAAAAPKAAQQGRPAGAETPKPPDESAQSNDGFLVNGSVNNAATSQFTLAQAFGNTRKGSKSLYNGGLSVVFGNSVLDARPYSLTGLNTTKPAYNKVTGIASFGGPLNIPHLMPHGPTFTLVYQWTRDAIADSKSGLVPTAEQRADAVTVGNAQALALLALYPLPNLTGGGNYNYQTSVLNNTHQDAMQLRSEKTVSRRDTVNGGFAFQSTRADSTSLFGFRDATDTLGLTANINWQHRFSHSLFATLGYRFSRQRMLVTPNFSNRINISGLAGISGNDQDPSDWGPPTLSFSSGIASLSDAQSAFNRNRTEAISLSAQYYRGRHNVTAGGDFRRQEFNYLSQGNPRGTFTFTGAAKGSDFADFINGIPDTSAIAYGNADKYLRQSVYDAYFMDDWRIRPELTINAGVRWEYGAPITELKNRLVNLDVANNFTGVRQVLASNPVGPLTGQHFPNSLLRPDRSAVEPRLSISWRPIPGSSLVVRAGYGIYADTSVYQATALQLAQQAPLSKSLSVQDSATCPQTLANGFNPCSTTTQNTFAVDPNFRVGYAQVWQVAVQRDLPAALQMTATYLGVKGSHGVQQFLPNTYPVGATNPCPSCPVGFIYRTSNGSSSRNAGSLQLRRRLRSGFTASLLYTYSKSIDDDSVLGGQGPLAAGATSQTSANAAVAQNWLDLHAERGLSTFDQRHLLNASLQYTTGMGLGGGTLLTGWRGRAFKEWTVVGTIAAGSGLPETPIYLVATNGTGVTGNLRPNRASATVATTSADHFLNANAFTAPAAGTFGNAGRDSLEGPGTFTFNASLSRTFRLSKTFNLDIRVDAENLLNHVVFTSYNNVLSPAPCIVDPSITCPGTPSITPSLAFSSPVFGVPVAANTMRSLQTTARLRF